MTLSLDLGCGNSVKNPFGAERAYGIDLRSHDKSVLKADLSKEPIPFDDDYFDFVTAFDFLEHIPRYSDYPASRNPFVDLMNEIYRVLKTQGIFLSFTPCFPSPSVFSDPTHVNVITTDTFPNYFVGNLPGADRYGFRGNFKLLANQWHDWKSWPLSVNAMAPNPGNTHLLTLLQKQG